MKLRYFLLTVIALCGILPAREKINLDKGWEFAFGNASSPALDFGCGTEYFTYLTKAASIHNEGPYSQSFDKSKWPAQWKTVDLPQDASSQGTYTDDNYIRAQRQKAFETTLHAQYCRILGYCFELKAGMGVNLFQLGITNCKDGSTKIFS